MLCTAADCVTDICHLRAFPECRYLASFIEILNKGRKGITESVAEGKYLRADAVSADRSVENVKLYISTGNRTPQPQRDNHDLLV